MKHILLPTDFSDNSWNAIVYAIHFYEKTNCHFYILHVDRPGAVSITPSIYGVSADFLNSTYVTSFKDQLKDLLDRILNQFSKNGHHKFFTISDSGSFIEVIRRQVQERHIELIVMGTKGASGLKKLLIGSNAGDVITKVKCTTLVVPEDAKLSHVKEICFPTDYSLDYEISHLQPVAEILGKFRASLRILHITKQKEELTVTQRKHKDFLEEYFDQLPISFHHLNNSKIEEAIECFVESRNVDIIAMVAKNINYFQQILFHSKIKNISYHTNIPFLVMHDK